MLYMNFHQNLMVNPNLKKGILNNEQEKVMNDLLQVYVKILTCYQL